jgi:hypothetical protein
VHRLSHPQGRRDTTSRPRTCPGRWAMVVRRQRPEPGPSLAGSAAAPRRRTHLPRMGCPPPPPGPWSTSTHVPPAHGIPTGRDLLRRSANVRIQTSWIASRCGPALEVPTERGESRDAPLSIAGGGRPGQRRTGLRPLPPYDHSPPTRTRLGPRRRVPPPVRVAQSVHESQETCVSRKCASFSSRISCSPAGRVSW